jgi:hypothetical protein
MAPALIYLQYAIHAGITLLFPGWVPLGQQRPRGLDVMGQRMLMLAGTWLAMAVGLLPGALVGALIWFALSGVLGVASWPLAAVACAIVVGLEVLAATEALGPLFERLDLTGVERVE